MDPKIEFDTLTQFSYRNMGQTVSHATLITGSPHFEEWPLEKVRKGPMLLFFCRL